MAETHQIHLAVAYFEDEDAAKEALKALKEAHKEEDLPLDGAAVISLDEEGKMHLKEVGDTRAKKGAGVGALIGGAVGALFGPLGIIGGGAIGAYYGGIVAATVDEGIPEEVLEEIATMLPKGGSALAALTTEEDAKVVEAKMAELGGKVITNGGAKAQVTLADEEEAAEAAEDTEDAAPAEAPADETEASSESAEEAETADSSDEENA
jgi:uncharacterized membrane protein